MTRASRWLAWREIRARPQRLLLSCAVIAVAVAIVAGAEAAALGREAGVAEAIDAMGPALYVAPAGASVDAVKRLHPIGSLPAGALERVRVAGGRPIRAVRARAFERKTVNGVPAAVIREGVDGAGGEPQWRVGAELASRAHVAVGSLAVLDRDVARIASVRPRMGDAEDFALAASAPERSVAERANVIEVYLRPGVTSAETAARLRAGLPDAAVLEVARGELADGGIQADLRRNRALLALVLGLAVVGTLGVATHLDVLDRRLELATLAAIGLSRAGLTLLVCLRAGACAVLGSAVALVALVAAPGSAVHATPLAVFAPVAGPVVAGALIASVAASLPAALAAAWRSPVAELQEG